jgi:threonine aldolase
MTVKLPVDLRSDTVTRPTPAMLEAMSAAPVGDDVFMEDPTVDALEKKAAAIFGMEAGLFCPSGTMTNQIGIKILTRSQEELICDHTSHVYLYEGGGLAFNSGLSVWLLQGDRGRITAAQVAESVRADNVHYPVSSVVSLENTHNRGGGSIYNLEEIRQIRNVCDINRMHLHLDGARIFNALAEAPYSAKDIGSLFDTVSVCLSKGLGAPVGSVLLSSSARIKEARRVRKVLGGGMRQAGYLAAAGIYALDHHVYRLSDDHRRAKVLGAAMSELPFVNEVMPVDTNIVVSKFNNDYPLDQFISKLESHQIKTVPFGKQALRMVTHLDFTDDMLDYTLMILKGL